MNMYVIYALDIDLQLSQVVGIFHYLVDAQNFVNNEAKDGFYHLEIRMKFVEYQIKDAIL